MPYYPTTHVSNAHKRAIWASVRVDRVYLEEASAKISAEYKKVKGSGSVHGKWVLYDIVSTLGFSRIQHFDFLPFKPQSSMDNVYISIYLEPEDKSDNAEPIVVAHPLIKNESVIVAPNGQMHLGKNGELWVDANGVRYK